MDVSAAFLEAKKATYGEEGGDYHGTDPDDRNPTRKGVIQLTYNDWRTKNGLPTQSVFNATDEEIDAVYHDYWVDAHCDELPYLVALACFDMAINAGPQRSIALFQQAMGLKGDVLHYTGDTDGVWGPKTAALAYKSRQAERETTWHLQTRRLAFYVRIADKPSEWNELRSWVTRCVNFQLKYL